MNQGVPKTAQYCSAKFKSKRDYAAKKDRPYDFGPEKSCMADIGIPTLGVSLCTIRFADDVDLEVRPGIIKDFTQKKHEYLKGLLDASFPDYFISQI